MIHARCECSRVPYAHHHLTDRNIIAAENVCGNSIICPGRKGNGWVMRDGALRPVRVPCKSPLYFQSITSILKCNECHKRVWLERDVFGGLFADYGLHYSGETQDPSVINGDLFIQSAL
jgi:hypothetical protein